MSTGERPPPRGLQPKAEVDALHLTVRGARKPETDQLAQGMVALLTLGIAVAVLTLPLGGDATLWGQIFLILSVFVNGAYRAARLVDTLPDVEEHIEHQVVLHEGGIRIDGPEHAIQLRPGRIGRATLEDDAGARQSLRIELMFPPDILWLNAVLADSRDIEWLADTINDRYCHPGEEDEQLTLKRQAEALRRRT